MQKFDNPQLQALYESIIKTGSMTIQQSGPSGPGSNWVPVIPKPLEVYLPQKPNPKNWWIGYAYDVNNRILTQGVLDMAIRYGADKFARIKFPMAGATDVENHHITIVYGIDQKHKDAVTQFIKDRKLTDMDLKPAYVTVTDENKQTVRVPDIKFMVTGDGKTVIGILRMEPNAEFEKLRDEIRSRFQTDPQWKAHPPHVTLFYGELKTSMKPDAQPN